MFLPVQGIPLYFRTRIPASKFIDRLEAEAAAIADAVFGPIIQTFVHVGDVSFVHINFSISQLTSGCSFHDDVEPLLAGFHHFIP